MIHAPQVANREVSKYNSEVQCDDICVLHWHLATGLSVGESKYMSSEHLVVVSSWQMMVHADASDCGIAVLKLKTELLGMLIPCALSCLVLMSSCPSFRTCESC